MPTVPRSAAGIADAETARPAVSAAAAKVSLTMFIGTSVKVYPSQTIEISTLDKGSGARLPRGDGAAGVRLMRRPAHIAAPGGVARRRPACLIAAMFRGSHKRVWRGAIGLIAAYALVLQVFLGYSVASQAAAQGDAPYADAFFVICASHHGVAAADDAGVPKPVPAAHCPICTLSSVTAATLPDPALLLARLSATVTRTLFISADACISFHRARAGLSRAPPQNA